MTILVKICGVTSLEAIDAAVEAGAAAVGFVFHAPSPRNLTPWRAATLSRRLPKGMLAVAVTLHPAQEDLDRVLDEFRPDAWQTDAEDFERLELPAGIERWPVLRARSAEAPPLSRRVLFDAPQSGIGRQACWSDAESIARENELILGGGLDASNVARAIAAVRPFGVDVSSGVESMPGVKDATLIRAFVRAAHSAATA